MLGRWCTGVSIEDGYAQLSQTGYDVLVGLLTVDANVAPGTAHLIASNAGGGTVVDIQIGSLTAVPGIQVQAGKLAGGAHIAFGAMCASHLRNRLPLRV